MVMPRHLPVRSCASPHGRLGSTSTPVHLEFVVRRRLGAGRGPCNGRPSAHGSGRQGSPRVHWRRPAAYGPPTTHGGVPHCGKPGTRQACAPDHGHSRTAHDREILAASSRSNARRRGVTEAHAARARREQSAVLAMHQRLMKRQERRGAQADGDLPDSPWTKEERRQSANQPVAQREVRRPLATTTKNDQLLLEHEILGDHGSHATGATELRSHNGEVQQGDQQVLHARVSVGQTPGATQRCSIRESARELAIRDPRVHVYAPGVTGYKPIALSVQPQPGLLTRGALYPPSEDYHFKPLNEHVQVYQ